ncbi:MAG: mandelate racemase/muconate lactonizing enzyme family protein [Sorangiineae bacterium]|nr:mandelate racemase/muconate lactonizing enzyme family protein [Polyangiaceae bacterium]MEB2324439.1 mandelate racemase/muconate lactonizing enzyme family protein [Sorangiineae bacterium]
MSRVARVELFHVVIPLPATFRPAWIPGLPQNENRFTLIRVTTDDGVEGYGAGPAMGRERAGLGELLGPYLLGADATDIELVQQRLREIGYLGWKNWWIEPAFWDISGKLAGKSVCELLGGTARTVELYASSGEVREPGARVEEAEARYAEGFRAFKLRVHDFDPRVDERQVSETAEALGGRMKLGVDVNQAWRVTIVSNAPRWDLARARRFTEVCADAGVAWVEEPLAMDAYDDLAALTAESRVRVTGGELHTAGLPELAMMIDRRCYSAFQPDAVFTGGIAQSIEVARLCRRRGLGFTPHTWTNGIGFAVNLQVFAASGFAGEELLEYPLDPPGWVPEARDGLLEEPFVHDRGTLRVPDAPGLGFRIAPRALARYGERFFVMDKKRLVWFSLRNRGLRASLEIAKRQRAARAPRGAR